MRGRAGWPALIGELLAQGRVVRIEVTGHPPLWVNADRRAWFEPRLPSSDASMVDIVRGRLEGLGPVSASAIAWSLGLPAAPVSAALAALEAEGFAMRGRFTPAAAGPAAAEEEWCERRLLARIHRYTVKRLRAEIEPVQATQFLCFLFEWQRVLPNARLQGPDAVAGVLAQLEGFEAPAGAWESDLLPARIAEYDPHWLDEHCRAGRFFWTRFQHLKRDAGADAHRAKGAAPVRATPITLLARRNLKAWSALTQAPDAAQLKARPRAVYEFIQDHGASFFDDIADGVRMLPAEVEEALAELVALGLVNSDGFAGLRALLVPSSQRARLGGRRRRVALFGMADAGRWAVVRRDAAAAQRPSEEAVEHVTRTLLRRWGVIFWRLLAREAEWLPSWRDLLLCCRRLEARGEIRGGRFVAGFSGEQFASPEAVGLLRDVRRRSATGQYLSLSGADPLNLVGIVTPGARLPALTGNRLLYLDGLPLATFAAGAVTFLERLEPQAEWRAQTALLRRYGPEEPAGANDDIEPAPARE